MTKLYTDMASGSARLDGAMSSMQTFLLRVVSYSDRKGLSLMRYCDRTTL